MNTTKRISVIVVFFIFIMAHLLLLGGCQSRSKSNNTIIIGAILPLTGPASTFGQYIKEGMDLAVGEINKKSSRKVEIKYEDSKGHPKDAVSAYNKLISIDKAPIVVAALSSVASVLHPLAKKTKTIQLYVDVTKPGVADGIYTFRIYPEANATAGRLAEFSAHQLSAHTAAIIYIDDDYGQASLKVFSHKFVSCGGRILMSDSYKLLQLDFLAITAKLRALQPAPDIIYLNGYGPAFVSLVKQIREARINSKLVADVALGLPENLEKIKKAAEGVYFVDGKISPNFIVKFEQKYKKKPSSDAGYAYDATRIVSLALRKQDHLASAVIRKVLIGLSDFPGVMGKITMNPNGDANLEFVIKIVRNGVPVIFQGKAND